jgi:hypothetical protein
MSYAKKIILAGKADQSEKAMLIQDESFNSERQTLNSKP